MRLKRRKILKNWSSLSQRSLGWPSDDLEDREVQQDWDCLFSGRVLHDDFLAMSGFNRVGAWPELEEGTLVFTSVVSVRSRMARVGQKSRRKWGRKSYKTAKLVWVFPLLRLQQWI